MVDLALILRRTPCFLHLSIPLSKKQDHFLTKSIFSSNSTFVNFHTNQSLKQANTTISHIYLTRGGNIYMTTGSLRYADDAGAYWSSTIYPSGLYAYRLGFNNTTVNPSYNSDRWYGFTARKIKYVLWINFLTKTNYQN